MRLSYRGINYADAPSTLEVTEGEIASVFRGQNNRQFPYLRHIPEPLPIRDRKFSPVAHHTSQATVAKPTVAAQPVATPSVRKLSTREKREALDEMMRIHQRNMQRSLEHRLRVARAKGDKNLIQLLEAESKQMMLGMQ